MTADVAIISSIYGGYDQIRPPAEQDIDVTWVMVTDRPAHCPPWQVQVVGRPGMHPRMAAKYPKAQPHLHAPGAGAYIWVDGSLEITGASFASWCVEMLSGHHLAQVRCPRGLPGEVRIATTMAKYAMQPVEAQQDHYLTRGHPIDWPVWWTGLIVRHAGCPDFGPAWLAEMSAWTVEDQVSQPYVLRNMGIHPADLPVHVPEVCDPVWPAPGGSPCPRPFTIHAHRDDL